MGYRESKTIFAIATRASKTTDSMKSEDIDGGSPASFDDRERGMSYDDALVCPPHTTERKLVSKIDFHVVPFLCILYLLAFLDRVNIANANVAGMSEDLHLEGDEYNTALVIFFVPYILFEIPSNILLKKFKPHVWLSGCMFLFGLTTTLQGVVQNYSGLLATRFFLGLFEAGMFPGCFYLLGTWYLRTEAQRRYSFFFSSTTLAGAFAGLLAAAIGKMDGIAGYQGWRWIFILEGILTCVVSAAFFFVLPDFPEDSNWLTPEEKHFVTNRLRSEQGASAVERKMGAKDVANVFKDYKIWLGGFMYFGLIVPAYSYAYFSPSIVNGYGYSKIQTQLHSVPPWAAAFAFAMILAWISDKTRHRLGYAIFAICVAITGFAILLVVHDNRPLEYAALFLVAMGCYSAMPIIVCCFNMNLGGHHRRSVGSAWQVAFGNIGGIIAVFSFLKKDAPLYKPGYSICIAFTCLSIVSCIAYYFACISQNRQRDKTATDVGLTEYEKTEMGDLNPEYRYLV
ncbi:major facilitator superfamily transporter [Aureobasidium pullulans]|uniref:Major facilitator superfamily transporter n=1 Tax=Aureobasidium pullulans TaxID=5580 RepID=A0A4S9SNG3_AURPU|nr:major facilitator superfamily transporter [Aureobasidium pullulans]